MSDHWKAFVEAISKPGAVVQVHVPHKNERQINIWDGHSFGDSATQFIAERIVALNGEKPL